MTAQALDRTLTAYRIGDPDGRFPIFDAAGSKVAPGRWNTQASPMIYACECYSTAMLEKLVHGSGVLPPNQHFISITIARGVSYEVAPVAGLPGWDSFPPGVSADFGAQWWVERRSVVLIVPSVVARMERNILINPDHPEFGLIEHSIHQPVWWDARLFGR